MVWNKRHNLSYKIPEYAVWIALRQRCLNPKNAAYKNYGGRGVSVYHGWDKFENFLEDVGRRPTNKHTIDRYPNNDGNYEPGNVRWATRKQQVENRRNSITLMVGEKILTLKEVADKFNVRYQTIMARYQRGWGVDRIINSPIRHFIDEKMVRNIIESELSPAKASKVFGLSKSQISYIRKRESNKTV